MVDGKIEIKLSLKDTAKELAKAAGTEDTMYYDRFVKSYFINGVDEALLENNGFKFFESSFNFTPIYKKGDIFATVHSDPAFGNVTLYKNRNNKLNFREE